MRAVGGTSVGRAFVDRRTCDSENGREERTVAFTDAVVGIEWICSYYWSSEADESAVIAQGSVGSKRSASHRNAERKARRKPRDLPLLTPRSTPGLHASPGANSNWQVSVRQLASKQSRIRQLGCTNWPLCACHWIRAIHRTTCQNFPVQMNLWLMGSCWLCLPR